MKAKPQSDFAKKWVGVVEVYSTEKKARMTSVDSKDGKVKVFPDGASTMDIALADLAKPLQRLIKPNIDRSKPRRFRVRLNADGDCVETVTPVSGVFPAKLIGLGPKQQDGTYKLIHKVYNEGKENENAHDEFIAIYEITEGLFKGIELPGYFLHYKFEEVPEGEESEGFTRFNCADTPQATQFHRLVRWAEVHGNILDEDIRWPDDGIILETIEERALDADRTVNLIFQDGYIKDVQAIEDYDDDEETEEEFDEKFSEPVVEVKANKSKVKTEEVKAKAPVKSAPAAKGKNGKHAADDDDDL